MPQNRGKIQDGHHDCFGHFGSDTKHEIDLLDRDPPTPLATGWGEIQTFNEYWLIERPAQSLAMIYKILLELEIEQAQMPTTRHNAPNSK